MRRRCAAPFAERPRAARLPSPWILMVCACLAACGSGPTEPDPRTPGIHLISGHAEKDTIWAWAATLVVALRDSSGSPVSNTPVQFSSVWPGENPFRVFVGDSIGSPSLSVSLQKSTDEAGRVSVGVRLGARTGVAELAVTAPELGFADTARYEVLPGRPIKLVLAPRDTAVYVGRTFELRSAVEDSEGNPTPADIAHSVGSDIVSFAEPILRGERIGRIWVAGESGGFRDTAWITVPPRGTIVAERRQHPTHDPAVMVTELDGTSYRALVDELPFLNSSAPTWSHAGDEVVFHHGAGNRRLFVAGLDGAFRRLLPDSPLAFELEGQYSRDGEWIYFIGGEDLHSELWRVRPDGTEPQRVGPPGDPTAAYSSPSPSPDGTRLAFVRGHSPPHRISVLDQLTGEIEDLGLPQGYTPRWSPDGAWLAYVEESPEHHLEGGPVLLARPDGSEYQVLTPPEVSYLPGLDWSPDGRWLVARSRWDTAIHVIEVSTGTILALGFTGALLRPQWRPEMEQN